MTVDPTQRRAGWLLALGAAVAIGGHAAEAEAASTPFGNDVVLGNSASGIINDLNDRRVQRFLAPYDVSVDQLHIQFNGVVGSVQTEVVLQADDGSGNPDGTDLAVAAFTATSSSLGYTAAFDSAVALAQDQIYHVVLRSTNADSNNRISWRILGNTTVPSAVNTMSPDGAATSGYAQGFSSNAGSSWSLSEVQSTVWALSNSSTQQVIGQPYNTMQVTGFGGDTWAGQKFTHTGDTGAVDSIAIQLRGLGGALTDDLRVRLATVASQGLASLEPGDPEALSIVPGTELFSGVLIASGAAPATGVGDLFTLAIPEASRPLITAGQEYVLLVETATAGVMQVRFAQGFDAGIGIGGTEGNFQGMLAGFFVTSNEALAANGLPERLFTSDFVSGSSGDTFFRDARFVLGVTEVPEPGTLMALVGAGVVLARRRRQSV